MILKVAYDSPSGNWTLVSRVTGGDTNHYTNEDLLTIQSRQFNNLSKWSLENQFAYLPVLVPITAPWEAYYSNLMESQRDLSNKNFQPKNV